MFKSLELNGFKSFADRTRFEFPNGITAVVGPNGSGKSNLVDAIKWVLGSQSAKALRGKEMTDVIFSGARSRGQTNSAEVTLTFDNASGILDVDADEVHITRRVYRSGEGEYLINRQPCRLRDIREIFTGTGVSTGAYSIIEQGKVDALLQSSPRERRAIFEEAAGISRFKLKRQEAARRLERVNQNLLRLSDIVDELDSRLKSVRSQAGRARKHKERSDRLKQLRTEVALADWRSIVADLDKLQNHAELHSDAAKLVRDQVANGDQQLAAADASADEVRHRLDDCRAKAASVRERIAQCESTRRSQAARSDELQQESQRLQKQLVAMTSRAGDAQQLVAETSEALTQAEEQFEQISNQVRSQQSELDSAQRELEDSRTALDQWREQHHDTFRKLSQLENQIEVSQSQRENALIATERCRAKLQEAESARATLAQQFATANDALQQLTDQADRSQQILTDSKNKLNEDRQQLAQLQTQLADLRGRLTGAQQRAIVLEELERRLDGLSAGTKEILQNSRDEPDGPFGNVRGLVADLLRVDADMAPLVEIALGDRANHLLIDRIDARVFANHESQWAGRTSFLQLDVPQPASAVDRIDLAGEQGVVGRADQFVEIAPDLAPLARRLLGRYWLVEDLQTALRLARGSGRGLNYVTVIGEVVRADGTLIVGPRQSATGLLSRRSELRALVDEIGQMQRQCEHLEAECTHREVAFAADEQRQQTSAEQHESIASQRSEARLKVASIDERLQHATLQHAAAFEELEAAEQQSVSFDTQLTSFGDQLSAQKQSLEQLQDNIHQGTEKSNALEKRVAALQRLVTDDRVALARCEQRRDGLRHQMDQLHRDHQEHDRALVETRQRESECLAQRRKMQTSVLEFSSELAELYHSKETSARSIQQLAQRDNQLRQQRSNLARELDQLRTKVLEIQSKHQQAQMRVQQREHQRDELSNRMADDYGLKMAELAATEPVVVLENRESREEEIAALRQQLKDVGSVNLESLTELEAVEDRHSSLARQYDDLCEAKDRLEKLVVQINVESRELFIDALNVIRGHFQELYSSLFGGGEADIVIDDGETADVLECGIEIIARPPGKQPRSMSLLSGGERTLTCVALLLAIFRSRPSPFCVLDEVDAALDEANIDRFIEVLKQFMASTQFIVVTHSKRTMSCADTLYGITMQESGVSKQVSVRFEDVSADGKIHAAPRSSKAA